MVFIISIFSFTFFYLLHLCKALGAEPYRGPLGNDKIAKSMSGSKVEVLDDSEDDNYMNQKERRRLSIKIKRNVSKSLTIDENYFR